MALLLMFHCEMDAGYAIDSLTDVFLEMANLLNTGDIHISFTKIDEKRSKYFLNKGVRVTEFDPSIFNKKNYEYIRNYVKSNNIDVVFGFDQPVHRPFYKYMRYGGVKKFISYCGAPSSDLNKGVKLAIKKLEVMLRRHSPDHYIYESEAMAKTAYQGRGIPRKKISIVPLGVDTNIYKPTLYDNYYAHEKFSISKERKIIYYSGHMEKRKGVDVLINAAKYLCKGLGRSDFHFLILGNRPGEEIVFKDMLKGHPAQYHVTFAGYRNDVRDILPSCTLGAIASTGWDSFTMSSLEIASCGVPLLVSDLQGLAETIIDGKTGLLFEPGNYEQLASHINDLLDNENKRELMSINARKRILASFSKNKQVNDLVTVMQNVVEFRKSNGVVKNI